MKSSLFNWPAFALAAGLAVFSGEAGAQAVCGKRADIIKNLEAKYGETRRSVGVQMGRGVVEVWASDKTGSWTILITNARGMSCLMAAGEAFEDLIRKPENGEPL